MLSGDIDILFPENLRAPISAGPEASPVTSQQSSLSFFPSPLKPRNQLRSFSWDFLRIVNIRSHELRIKVKQCYCHKPKIATRHESYVPPFVGRRVNQPRQSSLL